MKATIKTPNITQYSLRFDTSDGDIYHRCTWAEINLDHDTYTMTAKTDSGNYSYGWQPTPNAESFVGLMKRINADYLLDKIADANVFDFNESKHLVLEQAAKDGLSESEMLDIESIDHCGIEAFLMKVSDATDWDYYFIPTVEDYPPGAIAFVEVFTKYLQPILEEQSRK